MVISGAFTRHTTRRTELRPPVAASFRPAGTIASALQNGVFVEADVLLVHHSRDAVAWIIRLLSGSYWNHAALVVHSLSDGPESELQVIEAHWRGIRRVPLQQYLENHERSSVIAVRRVPGIILDRAARHRIARLAAEAVGRPYDFPLLLRMARLALRDMVRRYRSGRPALPALLRLSARLAGSSRGFICSGLVQWAYWAGVKSDLRERVVFVPGIDGPGSEALVREATPDHLARSANLEWAYLVHRGQVWAMESARVDPIGLSEPYLNQVA